MLRTTAAVVILLAALGCDDGDKPLTMIPGDAPAAAGSAEPNLAVGPDGRVWLTWIERADSLHAVKAAARDDRGTWKQPVTIVARNDLFVNWADFPSMAVLPNGDLVVHWLQRSGPGTYSYDVKIARSTDGGATWSNPLSPHRDSTRTEHGFASMFPLAADSVGAIWLDGRKYDTTRAPGTKEMMLVSTSIAANGSAGEEKHVDERICDCCQTSMALTAAGPVVVYRDRTTDEIRDIYITRRENGRWSAGKPVHDDRWNVTYCPVNGPAVSARGNRVVVAWFTAARDTARVHVAFSEDAGATFAEPIRVDEGNPAGRVDVELDPSGKTAWVTWLERSGGDTAAVKLRRVRPGKAPGEVTVVASSSGARASGFPRMARAGDSLYFAWTEPGSPPQVKFARAVVPRRSR